MSLSIVFVPIAIAVTSGVAIKIEERLSEGEYYQVNTTMKDETIIQEALENRGSEVTFDEHQIESKIGDIDIMFQRQDDETISAIFHKNVHVKDAEEFVENTYNEYTRIIQQQTYEKLMQRAENEGLLLQSETRNEENTIVLTFDVKE